MEKSNLRNFIAKRVKYFRKELGFSQETVSEKAGLEPKYINKLENEKYNLKIDTLEQILDALNISLDNFFNFKFPASSKGIENLLKDLEKVPEEDQEAVIDAISVLVSKIVNKEK